MTETIGYCEHANLEWQKEIAEIFEAYSAPKRFSSLKNQIEQSDYIERYALGFMGIPTPNAKTLHDAIWVTGDLSKAKKRSNIYKHLVAPPNEVIAHYPYYPNTANTAFHIPTSKWLDIAEYNGLGELDNVARYFIDNGSVYRSLRKWNNRTEERKYFGPPSRVEYSECESVRPDYDQDLDNPPLIVDRVTSVYSYNSDNTLTQETTYTLNSFDDKLEDGTITYPFKDYPRRSIFAFLMDSVADLFTSKR